VSNCQAMHLSPVKSIATKHNFIFYTMVMAYSIPSQSFAPCHRKFSQFAPERQKEKGTSESFTLTCDVRSPPPSCPSQFAPICKIQTCFIVDIFADLKFPWVNQLRAQQSTSTDNRYISRYISR
jgi:hypothetical protein